jgi:DNA ligase (NAD+)
MHKQKTATEIQEASEAFLKNKKIVDSQTVAELRDALRHHEHRYYVLSNPLISDYEYDNLYKLLEKFENENPNLVTPDSPTQRVAKGLSPDFKNVEHLVPMLSLENSYDANDLLDWDRKCKEFAEKENLTYCVEPKFDGASISLLYEKNMLTRAATRGDGVHGDDITQNAKQIRSIPLSANFSQYGIDQIEIRGEVLINKKNFEAYNKQLMEQNLPPLANPRNAASGSLRIKDSAEVGRRNLEAFLYHISFISGKTMDAAELKTHAGNIDMLWQLGFRSPKQEIKICKNIQEVIDYVTAFETKRDDMPYEIDGMVIKVNNLAEQEEMGMTTHHPRWAIAYKFKARQATGKLISVEYQVGRTGAVTPVAKLEPVQVGGVTVTSISMHNQEFIAERDLRIGDQVVIERAGDVIPYIVKSLPDLRTGAEQKIEFPKQCPVCQTALQKPEEEAVWRCNNYTCPAQVVERIIHFASKDCMDIRGLGQAQINRFNELDFLHNITDIYNLPYDKLEGLEGLGKKSIENLKTAIENSKQQPLFRLINALGIRYVGETTAKTIAQQVEHLLQLKNYSQEQLKTFDDVGEKVAQSIAAYFAEEHNIILLEQLEQAGLNLKGSKGQITKTEGSFSGKSFLFTGTLTALKRSQAEAMAEDKGANIASGVSSKLNYLVVGTDAGSKLEKAKKIASITILTEDEFIQMMQ